jgi:hypothetical protein
MCSWCRFLACNFATDTCLCRYKAEYRTSELLCRRTLQWVPATTELLQQLDAHDGTPCISALRAPIAHRDPPIPPWSLPSSVDGGWLTTKHSAGNSTAPSDSRRASKNENQNAATPPQPGIQDTAQGDSSSPPCARDDATREGGVANGEGVGASDAFKVGDVRASIGEHVMSVQQWKRVLRPSLTVRLQALAVEFVETVGAEVASVCVLDL